MIRKILVVCCLALFCLGTLVGCSGTAGGNTSPNDTSGNSAPSE